MSFDPHSQRLHPRWLSSGLETDGEQSSASREVSACFSDSELTRDVTDHVLDEAIQQIASEIRCVCPLCGSMIGS